MNLGTLCLKKHEEKRLLAGHLWIYSNEIDTKKSPLNEFRPGEVVRIESSFGKSLGLGYINPNILLSVRLLTRDVNENIDKDFFVRRVKRALEVRQNCYSEPFYRLIFSESDHLPGLIVDRFADVLVVQISTAGMENFKDLVIEALQEVLQPKAILWRNDSAKRKIEGLEQYVESAFAEPPQMIRLQENDTTFDVALWDGQKTGWFYDQRPNRKLFTNYVNGKRVLDVFSYTGACGIQAAVCGASEVVCIDSSAPAIELLQHNAKLNNVSDKIRTINDYAFIILKQLLYAKESFDVIILDPPALIKRRKDLKEGYYAYLRLQKLALGLLKKGGLLFTFSCSMLLSQVMLLDVLRQSELMCKKEIRILAGLHQGMDHPIHPAIWETDYLKGFFVQVF